MTGRPRLRYIDPRTGAGLDFFPDSIEAVNKLDGMDEIFPNIGIY